MVFQVNIRVAASANGNAAPPYVAQRHSRLQATVRTRQLNPPPVKVGKRNLDTERKHESVPSLSSTSGTEPFARNQEVIRTLAPVSDNVDTLDALPGDFSSVFGHNDLYLVTCALSELGQRFKYSANPSNVCRYLRFH